MYSDIVPGRYRYCMHSKAHNQHGCQAKCAGHSSDVNIHDVWAISIPPVGPAYQVWSLTATTQPLPRLAQNQQPESTT